MAPTTDVGGSAAARSITVLVVDDQYVVREGLRAVLAASIDFAYVGEAVNGVEAISLADSLQPDVIIMDLKMPELDGITATRKILEKHPNIRIVALTMFDEDVMAVRAVQAGARGYLLKGATHDQIVQTLRIVSSGALVLAPDVVNPMVQRLAVGSAHPSTFPKLTAREVEVLRMLCQGVGDHTIAERLFISTKTVRNHIASIVHKLGAESRLHATIMARDAGLDRAPS